MEDQTQEAHSPNSIFGDVLALEGTNSLNFLETAFACYSTGRVFAITRPDTSLTGLVRQVTTQPAPENLRRGWGQLDYDARRDATPAQIVFTSGTEGQPKAIVLSHESLADTVDRLNGIMQVTADIREYIGVPVTYSFGLGRARAVAAAGGRFFLPERFDPSEIRTMLQAGEINAISAVPSLWQMVLAVPDSIGEAGEAVRWIEIGSQYMSGSDKAALARLFPNARIVQHYGLTEASRSTFLDVTATPEAMLDSVGLPVGATELRLSEANAICIRGPHVAMGQLGADETLIPLTDADGWLITQDRGHMQDGYLHYDGRLDNQINVGGVKLSAEGLEAEIEALLPAVKGHIAATAVPDTRRGQGVLLGMEDDVADISPVIEEAARLALTRRGIDAKAALRLIRLEKLPRTGTDKIQRAALRDMDGNPSTATPEITHTAAKRVPLTAAQEAVAQSWQKVVGPVPMTPDQTFYDTGGDSLSSVQIALIMEASAYDRAAVRATLEGRSLAQVAQLSDTEAASTPTELDLPDQTVRNWGLSMARAIVVLSVLLSHWAPGVFARLGIEPQAERLLSIFYRMGTPGFAIIFGIGIGFYMLPGFHKNRGSVFRRLRSSFLLVLLGLGLLALSKLVLAGVAGKPITGRTVAVACYGVLTYYAIMLGTARLWLPPLTRLPRDIAVPSLLVLGLALWGLWQGAGDLISPTPQDSLLELPRLMLVAGYSVFKMSALACVGMAVGLWFSTQTDTWSATRLLISVGAIGALFCLLAIFELNGPDALARRGNSDFLQLPGLGLYVTLSLLMLGGFTRLAQIWNQLPRMIRGLLQGLVVTGGLALPIYVFHGLVIPLRDILSALGVGGGPALLLPMGAFLLATGYGAMRLYRMYFS